MSLSTNIAAHIRWRGIFFLIQFLVTLLLARTLGPTNGGHFFLLLNDLSLLVLIVSLSIESALVYLGASGQINFNSLYLITIIWTLIASGLAAALLFLFPLNWWQTNTTPWAICFVASTILTNFLSALYQVRKDFISYNKIIALVYLGLLVLLIAYDKGLLQHVKIINADTIGNAYFITIAFQSIILLVWGSTHWKMDRFPLPTGKQWSLLLQYSIKAFAANFLFFLVYRIDYWFVDHYCADAALGIYIQASKLAQAFILIPAFISTVLFPHTAEGNLQKNINPILQISRMILFIYSVGFIVLILLGNWLFPFLYGTVYAGMEIIFSALVPGILALSIQTILASWFAGTNEVGVNIKGAFLALVTIVLLDWWWIPLFGIIGAAWASSIGYIIYFLFEYFNFKRRNDFKSQDFFMIQGKDIKDLLLKIKSAIR